MDWFGSKRFITSFVEKLPLKLLAIVSLFLIVLWLFALVTHEVIIEKEYEFDHKLINLIAPYSAESFIRSMKFFTFFWLRKVFDSCIYTDRSLLLV